MTNEATNEEDQKGARATGGTHRAFVFSHEQKHWAFFVEASFVADVFGEATECRQKKIVRMFWRVSESEFIHKDFTNVAGSRWVWRSFEPP